MFFLPPGLRAQAKKSGAVKRKREIKSISALLRTLLIYLIDGCSLRETTVRARLGALCDMTPAALSKRLRNSKEWFHWMSMEILKKRGFDYNPPYWIKNYQVKCVDATVVSEPGSTGTNWRLHYGMSLFNLKAEQYHLTDPAKGESIQNFNIHKHELWLADRAYCQFNQLKYIRNKKAHFLVRYKARGLSLYRKGKAFDVLSFMNGTKPGQIISCQVKGRAKSEKRILSLRICAIAKSEEQAEKAIKEYKKQAKKKGKRYSQQTLELQKYTIVLTSLPASIDPEEILNLYRARWQVELAFKRMKSLIGLGLLPKKNPKACLAWLEGKMFVYFLVQSIIDEMNLFSPWGYPTQRIRIRKYMERNLINI